MPNTSYKIADNLYLVSTAINKQASPAKPVEQPINHLVCVDCSGSMSSDLPQIREQMKKKLPKLLKETDTISIVWFSGKGQFGTLLEAEPVATLTDLQQVNQAIDRWLKPVCLTGFKEPLEEVAALISRIGAKRPNSVFSLFFLSDGHDNVWPRDQVLTAVEKAANGLASATFVEYGYYADRPLLTRMAEKAGGQLIFSQNFDTYAPTFEAAMQRKSMGAKRIPVAIEGDPIGGFCFTVADGELTTYGLEGNVVFVPEATTEVWYVSPVGSNSLPALPGMDALYAAMSLYSVRMRPDVVLPMLKATGDVKFVKEFGGCYGKQRYSAFMDACKEACFDATKRLTQGFNPNMVPPDDAFTVLDLLDILSVDNGNNLLLDHPEFKYNKISRSSIDANTNLTAEEQAEIIALATQIATEKNAAKVKELTAKIAAINSAKKAPLKFVADKGDGKGYPITSLTYNEERPNISVMVRIPGTVDLSDRLPAEYSNVPKQFATFIFRNFAIVKDGIVNVAKLPVSVTSATAAKLVAKGFTVQDGIAVIDLSEMPVINRNMVKACSAKALFTQAWDLLNAQARSKVINDYKKARSPRTSKGFEEMYGADATAWLKEQGFTDYSGFGPKQIQAEAKDFYMAKSLKLSIKGYSTLPSMNELKKQAAKGKYNGPGTLMAPVVAEVEAYLDSHTDAEVDTWLDTEATLSVKGTRRLIAEIAKAAFITVVGQVWFTEFASLDDQTLAMDFGDQKGLVCKAELAEVKIEI